VNRAEFLSRNLKHLRVGAGLSVHGNRRRKERRKSKQQAASDVCIRENTNEMVNPDSRWASIANRHNVRRTEEQLRMSTDNTVLEAVGGYEKNKLQFTFGEWPSYGYGSLSRF
jgi:hypothetical protein